MVGLEVNPDHRPQFQIDEQQQNVIDLDMPFLEHPEKLHHRRPGGYRTNGEQRQVVEGLDEQVAQGLGQLMHVLPQFLGPVDFHVEDSLARFERMLLAGRDGYCTRTQMHAEKRPRHHGEAARNPRRGVWSHLCAGIGLTKSESGLH